MSIQTKDYKSKKTGKVTKKYYPVVYDPKSNKPIWGDGFLKKSDAKKQEAEMIGRLEEGSLKTKAKAPTFKEVGDLWIQTSRSDYADSTWRVYDYNYKFFLLPIFGDQRIDKITTEHILKYKAECEWTEEKAKILEKDPNADVLNYKPETVNKLFTILKNIFNFAKDTLKVINSSPMEGVKRCKVAEVKHTTWSEEEITYFLELPFVYESPYYAMLVLMFAVGTRPGEVCGLADTDLTPQRILTLHRGRNRYGHDSDLKNTRSHRPLKLSEALYDLILDQRKRKTTAIFKARNEGNLTPEEDNDYLFVGLNGRPVSPDCLSKNFKRLLRRNNKICEDHYAEYGVYPDGMHPLPDMRLYDTRHSFATNLLINGKKSKIIAEVMGNSVKTMEHHYAHIKETMHDETLEEYGAKVIPIKKII